MNKKAEDLEAKINLGLCRISTKARFLSRVYCNLGALGLDEEMKEYGIAYFLDDLERDADEISKLYGESIGEEIERLR